MRVILQFHATRSDIYSIVSEWAGEGELSLVGEAFFPEYRVFLLSATHLRQNQSPDTDRVDRISLQRGAVDLKATSSMEYLRKNPNGLSIFIGEYRDGFIFESLLGARTDDSDLIRMWRRFRNRAKRSMRRGAWVENKLSGARSRNDGHSYTLAAKELQDAGMEMVGQSEQIRYVLD
jgi:hypothetical protein